MMIPSGTRSSYLHVFLCNGRQPIHSACLQSFSITSTMCLKQRVMASGYSLHFFIEKYWKTLHCWSLVARRCLFSLMQILWMLCIIWIWWVSLTQFTYACRFIPQTISFHPNSLKIPFENFWCVDKLNSSISNGSSKFASPCIECPFFFAKCDSRFCCFVC